MKMNKSLGAVALTAGIIGTTLIPQNAYAHGFVEKPSSRSALCSPTYGALNVNCGIVMYEPQSLEAPKGSRKLAQLMVKSLLQVVSLVVF